MKSLMQIALADDWHQLPAALQLHYSAGRSVDRGHMDIQYPRWMQPILHILHWLGALIHRRGEGIATVVEKRIVGQQQFWQRRLVYPDGTTIGFDSTWILSGGDLIEFVNAFMGLRMRPQVCGQELHYRGVHFVLKLAALQIPIPEWLLLGRTSIIERAVDATHFEMDFRLTHPLFGQLFRYSGRFEASRVAEHGTMPSAR